MGTTTLVQDCQEGPLGSSVPPVTPHCLSVSLPTWKDTVGYMTGEKRVIDAMVSGYPRFVIPLNVRKVRLVIVRANFCIKYAHRRRDVAC